MRRSANIWQPRCSSPARIEAALDKAIAMLRDARKDQHTTDKRLAKRLRDVERTLANLTETAAKGGAVPAVLEALNRADAERRTLQREIESFTGFGRSAKIDETPSLDARALRRTLRGYLNWHAMIQGNVTEARGLLDVVLRERITFTPKTVNGVAMYELRIPIAFDRLLVSLVPGLDVGFSRVGLASPTGCATYPRQHYRPLNRARVRRVIDRTRSGSSARRGVRHWYPTAA